MIRICLLICLFPILSIAQDSEQYGIFEDNLMSSTFHKENRKRLRALMPENSVAIFFAAPTKKQSNDIFYTYHPDPNFYYLTGYREPNAVLVVFKNKVKMDSVYTDEMIFVQERKTKDEIWDGKRLGIKGVHDLLKFNEVRPNRSFADLKWEFPRFDQVFLNAPTKAVEDDPRNRGDLASMFKHLNIALELNNTKVSEFGLKEYMGRLRQIKTEEELKLIKRACAITSEAHNELMRTFETGMPEYRAQAIVEYYFAIEGAEKRGFPSICGSGDNSCILHYSSNRKKTEDGDLMLVDIGAEYHGYTADMTRTFPVNGKFSPEQKKIYDLVLKSQKAGIALCVIGQKFQAPHDKAVKVLAAGLMQLGVIKEYKEVYDYYMHGTSHYMGLDVHDSGLFGSFKHNQVVTVEPGIYIPTGSKCDKKWWGIGIRIEDDILITKSGYHVLTKGAPVTTQEIEALMRQESKIFKR